MGLRPGRTKGPWVGVSGGSGGDIVAVSPDDTTPGYLEDKIVEGLAQNITLLDPAGDEKLELTDGIAGFRDTFITESPSGLAVTLSYQVNGRLTLQMNG